MTQCAPCTSLREQEGGSSQISSSATNQSLPLSGTPTVAPCSESKPPTDGSPTCTCGKVTSGCLIHPNTRDEWIASMRASRVKISALLGIIEGSAKEREADFTGKCSEFLASLDRDTSSWKTAQPSLLTRSLERFSGTWPRAGMMRGGRVYRHPQPVPRTIVIDGGALRNVPTPTVSGNHNRKGASKTSGDGLETWVKMWPTPQARDFRSGDAPNSKRAIRKRMRGFSMNLNDAVRMWPTPCASASKGSSPRALIRKNGHSRENDRLDHAVMASDGGQLNPQFVEWLMGWPIGHTALKHSGTGKFRSKQRSRG